MITRINPPELGTPPGYSQIVEVTAGRIIFIAGQTALDRDGNVVGKNDFAAQAQQVFENLTIALRASGCTAANLTKLTVFLTDMDNLAPYREARNRSVPALRQGCHDALHDLVRDQRPRGVVHDDHGRVRRHLLDADPHRVGTRLAARDGRDDLPATKFLGEEDHRLLPAGRCDNDDRLHFRPQCL